MESGVREGLPPSLAAKAASLPLFPSLTGALASRKGKQRKEGEGGNSAVCFLGQAEDFLRERL